METRIRRDEKKFHKIVNKTFYSTECMHIYKVCQFFNCLYQLPQYFHPLFNALQCCLYSNLTAKYKKTAKLLWINLYYFQALATNRGTWNEKEQKFSFCDFFAVPLNNFSIARKMIFVLSHIYVHTHINFCIVLLWMKEMSFLFSLLLFLIKFFSEYMLITFGRFCFGEILYK